MTADILLVSVGTIVALAAYAVGVRALREPESDRDETVAGLARLSRRAVV